MNEELYELIDDGLERISQAAQFLSISRSKVYDLMNTGTLPSVKIGKSRRLPIRAVRKLAADNIVVAASPEQSPERTVANE